jgi:hypothetical protein
LTKRNLAQNFINSLDGLSPHLSPDDSTKEDYNNPLISIITPEWYYSESIRLESRAYNDWEKLEKLSVIKKVARKLSDYVASDYYDQFENTFSSWYQPYHYKPRDKWGIHLRYDSWVRTAKRLQLEYHSADSDSSESVKAAFLYFLNHQIFHYLTENAASVLEIVTEMPSLYTRYYSNVYSKLFNTRHCLEEALANSYLSQQASHCRIENEYLRKELKRQGKGYNNFVNYEGDQFFMGIRLLISQMRQSSTKPKLLFPLEQIMDMRCPQDPSIDLCIPIWMHREPKPLYKM